jgi:ribosomal protein S18 acetylase RimI-like enzyme
VPYLGVQIRCITHQDKDNFFEAYRGVYNSKEEAEAFYCRFLDNGWISGAWRNRKLIGVLAWAPREAVKNGLAEIIDIWVNKEERRKGIGRKLIDHALEQMKQYHQRFGSKLQRVMLFTGATEEYSAARALYEKKGFHIIATIPRGTLNNPYGNELLYVLQIST